MYACAGGHEEVVKALLEAGANVEDHNENGHTPLMEAASAGHVGVAKVSSQLSQRSSLICNKKLKSYGCCTFLYLVLYE